MKKVFVYFLVLLLSLSVVGVSVVEAQFESDPSENFEKAQADGLLHNEVLSVEIDRKGHKWFGTPIGVSELSGNDWYTYDKNDGFPNAAITAIAVDRDDYVWFGSDQGLVRLDSKRSFLTKFGANIGVKFERIFTLEIGKDKGVWIGSDNGVIEYDENKRWSNYASSEGDFTSGYVYGIDPDQVLIGAGTEVIEQRDGRLIYHKSPIRIPYVITDLFAVSDNEFWLGTSLGLIHVTGENWVIVDEKDGLANNYVTCLIDDGAGGLWAGTIDGLSHYTGGQFINYSTADDLASNMINDLALTKAGALWVGTNKGVSSVQGRTVRTYRAKQVFHDINDVPWASQYILDLKKKNIISGYADGSFRPSQPVSRVEVLKIGYKAAGVDVSNIDPSFNRFRDVDQNHWSAPYVLKAVQDEAMYSRNRYLFEPDAKATRAEAIMAVLGTFSIESDKNVRNTFTDVEAWQILPVETAVGLGIVKGFEDGTFKPNLPVTRAEFSKMIFNAMNL